MIFLLKKVCRSAKVNKKISYDNKLYRPLCRCRPGVHGREPRDDAPQGALRPAGRSCIPHSGKNTKKKIVSGYIQ